MRYALVGDSQGQGLFPHLQKHLEAAGHAVTLSRAVPGKPPSWWARDASLPGQLAGAQPDVVVYLIAGNNTDFNPASYGQSVATVVGYARSAGARTIYWLSPGTATKEPFTSNHNRTAEIEPPIMQSLGVTWLDMRPLTLTGHRSDGVHFVIPSAYQAWAAQVAPMVLPGAFALPGLPGGASLGAGAGSSALWWGLAAGVAVLGMLLFLRPREEE